MSESLVLLGLLFTKHFIVDFPLQHKYQWSNKGTYLHPGGLLHAGLHGIGTFLCFLMVSPLVGIYFGLLDAFFHYHIDWAKMNINMIMTWKPNTHEQFWWLLGLDQYLHAMTYIGLTAIVTC